MSAPQAPLRIWTAKQLADLVKQLRTVQKANGTGYKTPAGNAAARPLEAQVDAAIVQIEQTHIF